MNFLENGFEITGNWHNPDNNNGWAYIYMAFAADPTTIEPSLEDSFNTVLYGVVKIRMYAGACYRSWISA